ncbi:MAG: hypothetical protein PUF16_00705, partial [Lachnospiraceae bacterium]|nr:hypothetical protein [Lachnospiraceae bacterium]
NSEVSRYWRIFRIRDVTLFTESITYPTTSDFMSIKRCRTISPFLGIRMIVVVFGDPIASFRKVPPCGTDEHTTF